MERLKIEEVLEKEGIYIATISGRSMYPMLREGKDTIVVKTCNERLKKNDIPLYRVRDKYILHRIIEVRPDSYVICGDNCLTKEYDITDQDIIGVLTSFYRGEKEIDMNGLAYKTYVAIWTHTFLLRCFLKKIYRRIKRYCTRKV